MKDNKTINLLDLETYDFKQRAIICHLPENADFKEKQDAFSKMDSAEDILTNFYFDGDEDKALEFLRDDFKKIYETIDSEINYNDTLKEIEKEKQAEGA